MRGESVIVRFVEWQARGTPRLRRRADRHVVHAWHFF
jgi:hypothetical protein